MNAQENTHHAPIQCPHASALWEAMREVWSIPRFASPVREDWLESWLISLPLEQCSRILMIAWRAWHARNEVVHDKPLPSIAGSRRFLCSYMRSLENCRTLTSEEIIKVRKLLRGNSLLVFSL